jgi:hypothetical protein
MQDMLVRRELQIVQEQRPEARLAVVEAPRLVEGKQYIMMDMARVGIKINTSPTNYRPMRALQLMRWDGETWARFGNVIEGAQA